MKTNGEKRALTLGIIGCLLYVIGDFSSSHSKGETVILSKEPLDEKALRAAIDATGYKAGEICTETYVKRGLFSFLKK